jgi:hypothetical protein
MGIAQSLEESLSAQAVMAEFDRQVGIDPSVQITDIDIPFWGMVTLIIKLYVAWLVASVMIGAIFGAFGVVFLILSNR